MNNLRRIFNSILVIFLVSSSCFFILSLLPGTPEEAKIGERAFKIEKYKNPLKRFLNYVGDIPQNGLGRSLVTGRKVINEILEALPYSIFLASFSILLSLTFSFPICIFSILKENKFLDFIIVVFSIFFNSLPVISLGPFLIFVFSVWMGFFSVSGFEGFKSLILPSLTLSIPFTGYLVRIIRKALLEELKRGYIFSLRARGIPFKRIVLFHVLRNSIFPLLTILSLRLGGLITGAILTESLFSIPGMGNLLVRSIAGRDYNLIFGIILFSSFTYVFLNLLTDIAYAFFDPRVRYASN